MSTKRKSTQSTDHTHFNDLPELQQQTIFEMLALDLEFDYIIKSKRGDTKIRFSETGYYKSPSNTPSGTMLDNDGTNLKYSSSTYSQILDIASDVLQSRFVHSNPALRNTEYCITKLPTGSCLFGRKPKNIANDTSRTNATFVPIDCQEAWQSYRD